MRSDRRERPPYREQDVASLKANRSQTIATPTIKRKTPSLDARG